jgi:hypothetical protein
MKNSWHDFPEMLPDAATKGVRRKDPPSASQLAAERGRDRERGAKDVLAKLAEMLAREIASPAPATAPPPPHVPLPPGAPRPPELKYDARVGWHIPCTLSREQLAKMDAWARSDRSR